MASRKKRRTTPEENKATAEYYKLHSQAVKDLTEANEENSPVVSEEELRKYRSGSKIVLPEWLKAILIKCWFAGSVCFFIFWGLSTYVTAQLDLLAIFAIVLGIVTDLLTNNVLRHFSVTVGSNDRWMMFPKKNYISFILNILYAIVLMVCVDMLYSFINTAIVAVGGEDTRILGVGPILFGIFYTGFDLLFITIKRTMQSVIADAKIKAKRHI